ncbi:unnamed protein product, partial [Polarella glacialis]
DLQQIIPQKRGALRVTFRMAEGRSILMGALARIDMAEGRPYQFTVFASEKLKIHECAIDKADWIAQRWAGGKLTPPMKAEQFAPMQPWVLHRFELTGRGWDEACVDLVVHGLGWVALTGVGDFVVEAWAPQGVAITLREPIMPFEAKWTGVVYHGWPSWYKVNGRPTKAMGLGKARLKLKGRRF